MAPLCRLTDGAALAQALERLTVEREVAGSIPGVGPILRVLKKLRNEATTFVLQMARPSRGSDDHVKWQSRLQWETENSVPSWYFRAKYIDTQIKCIFLHELVEICNKAAPKFP